MKRLNFTGRAGALLIVAFLLGACVFQGCAPKPKADTITDQEMAGLWSRAAALKTNDFAGLFTVAQDTKREPAQQLILFLTIDSWLESDPVSTLNSICALTEPEQRETALNLAFGILVKKDCTKLLDYIGKVNDPREKRVLLSRCFEFLEKQNLPVVLKWGKENLNAADYPRLQGKVFSRWATLDPAECGQALLKEGPRVSDEIVRNFAREWAAVDFARTVAWLSRAPNAAILKAGINGMIESQDVRTAENAEFLRLKFPARWNEMEVARAIGRKLLAINAGEGIKFLENANVSNKGDLVYSVLQKWALEMPDQAFGMLTNSSGITKDAFAVDGLFAGLVISRPDKATALLTSNFKSLSELYLPAAITGWLHSDLEGLKAFVAGGGMQIRVVDLFCSQWGRVAPEEATKWAAGLLHPKMRQWALDALSAYAGQVSVQTIMAIIDEIPDDRVKGKWVSALMKQYSPEQSLQLLAWIERLKAGETKSAALGALAGLWARQDPRAAMEYFNKIEDKQVRSIDMERIAAVWAGASPKDAFQWLTSQGDAESKNRLIPQVLEKAAASDPALAVELLSQVSDKNTYDRSLSGITSSYAKADPQAAAKWVLELPGEAKSRNLGVVGRTWSLNDPQAAADWIATLSQQDKDAAIPLFVTGADGGRPDLAAIWANELSDEKQRLESIANAIGRWYEKDPAAALAWLPNARIPEDIRQKLKTGLHKGWD